MWINEIHKNFRRIEMILTRQDCIVLSHVFGESMIISGKDIQLFGEHLLKNIDLLHKIL